MNSEILSVEIFAILLELVIIYATIFETKYKNLKSKIFLMLSSSVLISIVLDALSYFPINWGSVPKVMFTHELLVYMSPFATLCLFLVYMYTHLKEHVNVKGHFIIVGSMLCVMGVVITLYLCLTGQIFKIIEGYYYRQDKYDDYLKLYIIVLAYIIFVLVFYSNRLGLHDSMAYITFMLIPIFFIIINIFQPALAFSIPSLSLSNIVVYVMLQSEHTNELLSKEQESYVLAHQDKLTGLQNRLAYSKVVESMTGDEILGVVFCDVNGLKVTNDKYGHKAGDQLLIDFSNLLLSLYRKTDLFRISGDEFVVILKKMPRDLFEIKKEQLYQMRDEKEIPIASAGFAYGVEHDIQILIETAEKNMYEDKQIFYMNYPEYGRDKKEDIA